MTPHYLKLPDEATGLAALSGFIAHDDDGRPMPEGHGPLGDYAIVGSGTGVVRKPTGNVIDVEGVPTPETAPVAGWHANVMCEALPAELAPYEVFPNAPVQVWQ